MITHVAIKFRGILYSLSAPNRHHHVIGEIARAVGGPIHNDEQGFLDDQGNFLTRKEALAHALACNQVKDPTNIRAGILFSEDVW